MSKRLVDYSKESGFTIGDLSIAILIMLILVGAIGTVFVNIYQISAETKINAEISTYMIKILEDIDKIDYSSVQNNMEDIYKTKFNIPSSIQLSINVSNYNEGNSKKDVIKKVNCSLSYEFSGKTRNMTIQKLKIKEF